MFFAKIALQHKLLRNIYTFNLRPLTFYFPDILPVYFVSLSSTLASHPSIDLHLPSSSRSVTPVMEERYRWPMNPAGSVCNLHLFPSTALTSSPMGRPLSSPYQIKTDRRQVPTIYTTCSLLSPDSMSVLTAADPLLRI